MCPRRSTIGEEFRDQTVSLETLCEILEGSVIKRMAMGRPFGVALLAEGLSERLDPDELSRHTEIERDAHGNIRYAEIELGRMLKNEVRRRLRERGIQLTIVDKDIGYELRCADPIPSDLEYTQDLGYAAVQFLLSGGTGSIVTIDRGQLIPVPFPNILDERTGRSRVREVDVDSNSYKVARHYMIRLEGSDFADPKAVERLATIGNMQAQEFERRFNYLAGDPPVRPKRQIETPVTENSAPSRR